MSLARRAWAKASTAIPSAFNQRGQAAGYAQTDAIGQHACFLDNDASDSLHDLGTLPGDWSSFARCMNDLGHVVGQSHPPVGSRPVLWNSDPAHTPAELPLLPGDNYGSATAINKLGHMIGWSAYSTPGTWNVGAPSLVVWLDGRVFELQSLLDTVSGAGWTLTSAWAINNVGQIAGMGVHERVERAFIMTLNP